MTKRILIIGLGNFGSRLATQLAGRSGFEIHALEKLKDARDKVEAYATCYGGNLENPEVLVRCLDKLNDIDTAIICLGTSTSAISLTALQLRKHDSVRRVIIKVDDNQHEELLNAIDHGLAGESKFTIINPEISAASNTAELILNENVANRVELAGDVALIELSCPAKLAGTMLKDLDLRQTWQINVIGYRDEEQQFHLAGPESVLVEGATITIVGHDKKLQAVSKE